MGKVDVVRRKNGKTLGFFTLVDVDQKDQVLSDHHVILGQDVDVKLKTTRGDGGSAAQANTDHEKKSRAVGGGDAQAKDAPTGVEGVRFYVGGLPPEAQVADLEEHFSLYSQVVNAEVVQRKDGKNFGFFMLEDTSQTDQVLSDQHAILGTDVQVRAL